MTNLNTAASVSTQAPVTNAFVKPMMMRQDGDLVRAGSSTFINGVTARLTASLQGEDQLLSFITGHLDNILLVDKQTGEFVVPAGMELAEDLTKQFLSKGVADQYTYTFHLLDLVDLSVIASNRTFVDDPEVAAPKASWLADIEAELESDPEQESSEYENTSSGIARLKVYAEKDGKTVRVASSDIPDEAGHRRSIAILKAVLKRGGTCTVDMHPTSELRKAMQVQSTAKPA